MRNKYICDICGHEKLEDHPNKSPATMDITLKCRNRNPDNVHMVFEDVCPGCMDYVAQALESAIAARQSNG